jgi:hypothetical protein
MESRKIRWNGLVCCTKRSHGVGGVFKLFEVLIFLSPSLLFFICREKGDAFVFRAPKLIFLHFLTYVFQHADSATTSRRIVRIQALSTTSRHYRFDPFQNATLEDTEPGSQLIISSREGCSYIKAE